MKNQEVIDHLFRHQYGKMVSILTRIFGLTNLELVEDAVQDTFIKAMQHWTVEIPENPEAWLTKAAKNRVVDLFRKIEADKARIEKLDYGPSVIAIDNLFEKHEVEDSQLRMIFTACHPSLHPKDQLSFALKTISGFSQNEIAAALLLKPETVKKRLSRARKTIKEKQIKFELPQKANLEDRLVRVYEVLYLIFNEGFHSNHKKLLVRKELCGEAMRLTKMLLTKPEFRNGTSYALFGLMCFHASRMEAKVDESFESISLKDQDRSKWFQPLIHLGQNAMASAMGYQDYSIYHIEAAIALEHLKAQAFDDTDWNKILTLYEQLAAYQDNPIIELSIATVLLHLNKPKEAFKLLSKLNKQSLEQKGYLFYGVLSKYYNRIGKNDKAVKCLNDAINLVGNETEKRYLIKKRDKLQK